MRIERRQNARERGSDGLRGTIIVNRAQFSLSVRPRSTIIVIQIHRLDHIKYQITPNFSLPLYARSFFSAFTKFLRFFSGNITKSVWVKDFEFNRRDIGSSRTISSINLGMRRPTTMLDSDSIVARPLRSDSSSMAIKHSEIDQAAGRRRQVSVSTWLGCVILASANKKRENIHIHTLITWTAIALEQKRWEKKKNFRKPIAFFEPLLRTCCGVSRTL